MKMGGRENRVSRIQQDSRGKEERKGRKGKGGEEKKRKKREEGEGQVTWMGQPRNGEEQEEEGRSGSLCSHLLLWDVSLSVTTYF